MTDVFRSQFHRRSIEKTDLQKALKANEQSIKYLQEASTLYQNQGNLSQGRLVQARALQRYINSRSPERLQDKYPGLMKELNSSESRVPAYMRFQRQDMDSCMLRQDLRPIKAAHFPKLYGKQIKNTEKTLSDVQFNGKNLDATKFYELKYFLTEE